MWHQYRVLQIHQNIPILYLELINHFNDFDKFYQIFTVFLLITIVYYAMIIQVKAKREEMRFV